MTVATLVARNANETDDVYVRIWWDSGISICAFAINLALIAAKMFSNSIYTYIS